MLSQVDATLAEKLDVLSAVLLSEWGTWGDVWSSTVNLEGTDGSNDNNDIWYESGRSALDVEETLTTHGEVETGLSDNVSGLLLWILILLSSGKLQGELVSNDGRSTDGDVGEWTSVDENWSSLQSLHKVRLDSILHEGSKSTSNTEIVTGNWLSLLGGTNDHASESLSHISKVVGQSQNSHTLGSDSNVESSDTSVTLLSWGQSNLDLTEMTIVNIEDTLPGDAFWVNVETGEAGDLLIGQIIWVGLGDAQLLETAVPDWSELTDTLLLWYQTVEEWLVLLGRLVEHSGVDGSSEQVVGGTNGVDITSQVHVELIHRNDLSVTSSSSSSLDTKGWSLGWLSDVGEANLVQVGTESLGDTHGGGRLALAQWGWGDTSNQNVLSVLAMLESVIDIELDLSLVGTEQLNLVLSKTELLGDCLDVLWALSSGDGNVGWNWGLELQWERGDVSLGVLLGVSLSRGNDVLEKHSNGHWSNSSWNWGDLRGNLGGGLVVDISNKSLSGLLGGIWNVVGSDINDNGTWLQPFTLDEVGLSDGGNDDISLLDDLWEVLCPRVADGDCGIGVLEEVGSWGTDDIRSAENNSVLSLEVDTGLLKENHDTLWRAWGEEWLSTTLSKLTNVVGSETIDILSDGNGFCDIDLVDVFWEWELDKETVNGWVVVDFLNVLEEL